MMKIGFIGFGRMAYALAKGFVSAGLTKGDKLLASCAPEDFMSIQALESVGGKIIPNNRELVNSSEIIIIAVKPNTVPTILEDIREAVTPLHLILSIAMGISIKQLEQNLPKKSRVIRVMPNTAAIVQKSASVFTRGSSVTKDDAEIANQLFSSVGTCEEVSEYLLDPITALSGSGPAYIYVMIESLADGAVRMGMPRDLAYRLAAQTVIGAGEMVLHSGQHPGVLKDQVSSPAGSTAEGLYCLEQGRLRGTVMTAIEQATKRCREVSNQYTN